MAIPATLMNVEAVLKPGSHFKAPTHGRTSCFPVTLIGIDHRSEEVKFRDAEGRVNTMGRAGGSFGRNRDAKLGKPMTPDEIKKWEELLDAKQKAKDAFYRFNEKFEFGYGKAEEMVKKAQGEKVDDPGEEPEPDEDPR